MARAKGRADLKGFINYGLGLISSRGGSKPSNLYQSKADKRGGGGRRSLWITNPPIVNLLLIRTVLPK